MAGVSFNVAARRAEGISPAKALDRRRSSASFLVRLLALATCFAPALLPAGNAGAAMGSAPPARQAPRALSAARQDWGPVQIVIYKSTRTLALYRSGRFEKQYAVVLGLSPEGHKRHEGDARTPEGLYRVIGHREHARWQHFLALDYPNEADRRSYDDQVARGRIPVEDGKPLGIGGAIGIHGNDRPAEQEAGKDWTKGCIALRAEDARELAAAVPVGTPVWIVE